MQVVRFEGGPLDGQEKKVDSLYPRHCVPVLRRPLPEDEPIFAQRRAIHMAEILGDYDGPPAPPDPTLGSVIYRLDGIDGAVGVYRVESKPDWWQ